jgi:hypothetical protein
MTIRKIVNLLMRISKIHPYLGELSKENQVAGAIATAELAKEFAENGQTDEAMNIPVEHWNEVIKQLKAK